MSIRRLHPFYVVRDPRDVGCGHQHSARQQAANCALAMLHRQPAMQYARVVRVRVRQTSDTVTEYTVATIENQPLSQRGKNKE